LSDQIQLRALRALGTHGALPEERKQPQPFEVDLDICADLRAAGASDDLSATIDYGAVTEAVVAAIEGPHAELMEHLAERIATAVLQLSGARAMSVTVTVRKLRPPVPVHLASAAIRITRP
jgi:dihydroneopterin aldolase/2-amino-4-hydroxy-6-hydroxymethyldihydropteridine diphosphokinase